MAAATRQPGSVSIDSVRESVKRARLIPPEQQQWTALFNCDEYAVVYAEKP
jgi:hypothetical protein